MSRLEVDPGELSALAARLAEFTTVGQRARGRLGELGVAQTGHPGLATAAGQFANAWEYSLTKIGENAAAVADTLAHAAQGYRTTDDTIAGAASGDG